MMPLYEGIALIQEKQPVVLDLGYDYTKFGFAGEAAPRCIIKSEFWSTSERRMKRVFDYKTEDELYENLVDMLHMLYFKHVLVNPKERKMVVVESLLTPTQFRETLAKVLFLHYEVAGAAWADSPRLCALTLGAAHCLVVELGYTDAQVTAVVHGSPILRALHSQPIAARAIHDTLATMLDLDNDEKLELPDHVLEDIKVKTCFVGSRARWLQWLAAEEAPAAAPAPARPVSYPVTGRSAIKISGKSRELAASAMFARDNEMASLPDMILQCIMQCPIDSRRPLAENILVTGGTANLPGLKARLAEELKYLITQPPYSTHLRVKTFAFHSAPAHANSCAWAGAALAAAAGPLAAARATARDTYLRERRLRDWVCLLYNTPATHPLYRDYVDNKDDH